MRILLLTQYFPPETGAPQNRLFELAVRFQARGHRVDVLTAMPNYPRMEIHEDYRGRFFHRETIEGLEVHRAFIYTSPDRSTVKRLLNYFSFVCTSLLKGLGMAGRWDYILCESPPLFLGISAVVLSKWKRAKLIFNVSDLWPESAERLGLVTHPVALRLSYALEAWIYRNSFLVTGQTQGIVADISRRFKGKRTYWLPNGVDTKRYDPGGRHGDWRAEAGFEKDHVLLLYAGIIGHAQGLQVVLEAARLVKNDRVQFILLGEGPEKEALVRKASEMGLANVHFLPGVPREHMRNIIASIDAALVPLRRLDLFRGAIPSKIFENLAMEKPVFLGVEGEAKALFIDQAQAGWFFEPENARALADVIGEVVSQPGDMLQYGKNGRRFVKEHFDRDSIVQRFEAYLNKFEQ